MSDTAQLEVQLTELAAKVELLAAKDSIRDCLLRINRGMDRGDERLMLSGFHPDAEICWGSADPVPLAQWIEVGRVVIAQAVRVQHLIGNVLIEIEGNLANVESYEIAHLTSGDHGPSDTIMASRYVDKFERREGDWRVKRRDKVTDWFRVMEAMDDLWGKAALRAARDGSDVSVQAFGAAAFSSSGR